MECNKDEALRAKELAETKLVQKDILGAQKLAIKAHKLFPALEGLSPLIATLDVYVSAEKRINGEVDFYRVLGVDPLADDETIRKNYRKLALSLHPDKNKAAGAEGAFKIVSEAWSLLSDKAKKAAYDLKRSMGAMIEKVVMQKSSMSAGKNGYHSSVVNQQKTSNPQPTQAYPRPSKPNTFWTSCARCFVHYEYLRDYLNQRLLCPGCHQPFLAIEMPVPSGNPNISTGWSPRMQHPIPSHHAANNPVPAVGGVGEPSSVTVQHGRPSKSGISGSGVKLKREREAETAAGGEGALQTKRKADGSAKKRRVDEHKWNSNNRDSTHQMALGREGSLYVNGKGNAGGDRVTFPSRNKPNSMRELSLSETRIMLMTKARTAILKKLDEWDLASKEEVRKVKKDDADSPTVDMKKAGFSVVRKGGMNRSSANIKNHVQPKHSSKPSVIGDLEVKPNEIMSMSVPDPDFHDFDKDRTEKSFGENQVWAAYDNDDGMPRFYALVNRVISKRPFRLKMGWLNSKSNADLGPINWVGSGFPKTSGEFHIGKYEVNGTLNAFSHKVKFTRGIRGVVQIFPAKGDVWALYKNWSPDWNPLTDEKLIHTYEMVLVLEDYTEEQGVTVTPLVKVAGFRSVFQEQLDLREARKIPREEMFRFSHQVPSYPLTGQEAQKVPKGCRELDPAALPPELLQVITEAKSVENVENVKEELPVISKKTEGKGVITYSRKMVGRKTKEGGGKEGAGTAVVAKEKQVMGSG